MNKETIEKLKCCFDEMVVFKDLKKSNFFSALSLPSFLRDWLLKRFQNEEGMYDQHEVADFAKERIPRKDDWTAIKNRIVIEHERVKFLAKISIDIDIKTKEVSFSLPDFSLSHKETIIEPDVWDECKDQLISGKEVWGMIELGYRFPTKKEKGKIKLVGFKNFCPYDINLDFFKDARNEFKISEWIDILLGAVDYNADGYTESISKLTMLTRLLPFVEKRLNLIELAPKGTGKSYLFGRVSRYGWLSSGGIMSRAKMFYDISKRTAGLICNYDFVTLDEIKSISFTDEAEMQAALQGYMESGVFTVGNYGGVAEAGIILCGNISNEKMDDYCDMFEELPRVFHESALVDRIHGFIKGWDIPRMKDDLKATGWALNSEYFCSIMHELRSDTTYRSIVDSIIEVPAAADTRHTEAVKRIATAYLKLLFPNVRKANDITKWEFNEYCLRPAAKMRGIINTQLGILDARYREEPFPTFSIKEGVCKNEEN